DGRLAVGGRGCYGRLGGVGGHDGVLEVFLCGLRTAFDSQRGRNSRIQAGHLPSGQRSCGKRALAPVKQPQTLQRRPVWCSQAVQTLRRCWCTAWGTVRRPDFTNLAIDLALDRAIRSRPGPCTSALAAAPGATVQLAVTTAPPRGDASRGNGAVAPRLLN